MRHQIGILHRSVKRPKLTRRSIPVGLALYCLAGLVIRCRPHEARYGHGLAAQGFRLFWAWKIRRGKPDRPAVPKDVRELIRTLSRENPIWGAPRIYGKLLGLGIEIGETSVAKYMVWRRTPPSRTCRTFVDNHLKSMVSVDSFAVPAIWFQILYVLLVLAHDRRRILRLAVTAHPTADWIAQQMREAFPWDTAPRDLIRDRDRIFGNDFVDQVKAMGSNKCFRRRGRHGRMPMLKARSAPFAARAWIT